MNPVSCIYDKVQISMILHTALIQPDIPLRELTEVTVSCSRQGCKYPLTKCNAIENMDLFTKLLGLNGNIIYRL